MRFSAFAIFAVTVWGIVCPAHAGLCGSADSVQCELVQGSVLVVVVAPRTSVVVAVDDVVETTVVDVVVGSVPVGTLIFATKTSVLPAALAWNAPSVIGKPPELCPVTYALPSPSTAMA